MRVVKISLLGLALMASATGFSQDILWETNFGGNNNDYYYSVTEVSDGIVAVGHSTTSSFGSGNLVGLTGRGGLDAIIVKYDNSGNVVWKKNFGGNNNDYYYSVTEVSDGIVAVGHSYPGSFENGDLAGIAGKGNDDAIIVKYDNAGNVVWKKNFGGNANDYFRYVTTVSDGIVVVGHSYAGSFGNGDLAGFTWKGDADAIIVKYDNSGNIVWTSHFGGSGVNIFNAVTAVSDGIVAGGYASVIDGDLAGLTGQGEVDAILVKYDTEGNVVWIKNFGGSDSDYYNSVIAVADGIIAAGSSFGGWGSGNLAGLTGQGGYDATIVKYDTEGNIVWASNFGGSGNDSYRSVTAVADGIIAVGYVSVIDGDLAGLTGQGGIDAIIVKYDTDGNIVWKKNFGGSSSDYYNFVTTVSDGIMAVGYASVIDGDLAGLTGQGGLDAIIVKYLIPVINIVNVPTNAVIGTALTLTGTIEPSNASYQNIIWSVSSAGNTGAVITGNDFFSLSEGMAIITATIANGTAIGKDYTKSFYITVGNVGVVETRHATSLRIYPNPTDGKLHITTVGAGLKPAPTTTNIELFDVVGQVVGTYRIRPENTETVIDISHLANGLYFLKIDGKMFKVVKQ